MTDLIIIVIGVSTGLIGGLFVYRYAKRQVDEALALEAKGWRCIGFDFLRGPIMIPPRIDFKGDDRGGG